MAVPARWLDVDGHGLVGCVATHGGEGVETVAIAAPSPVEVVLVVVVVAIQHEGVSSLVVGTRIFNRSGIVNLIPDQRNPQSVIIQ